MRGMGDGWTHNITKAPLPSITIILTNKPKHNKHLFTANTPQDQVTTRNNPCQNQHDINYHNPQTSID
jgi:hypothetical protein